MGGLVVGRADDDVFYPFHSLGKQIRYAFDRMIIVNINVIYI